MTAGVKYVHHSPYISVIRRLSAPGPIQRGGNFMWLADELGTFPYRCSYHGTQMLATLKVVS